MSSASFALPESDADFAPRLTTGFASRLLRLTRLFLHLGRIWVAAWLVADRVGYEVHFALKRRYAQRMLRLLGIDAVVRGEVPAYDEPVLVVSNHISWLDPYALNTVTGARFVAKSEVESWPIIGTSARGFGAFFIRRGSCRSAARVKDQLARALRGRDPVGAFPESTTTDGTTVMRFYPALFQAAIDARAMVQPVAIRYLDGVGRPTDAAAFIGEMSIAESLRRLLPVPKLVVELTFCAPLYSRGRSRKELAARARKVIADALDLACDDEPLPRSRSYPKKAA